MWGHPRHMDRPGTDPDKEQHIIGDQPTPRPDLHREEIRRHEHTHMHPDELFPRGGGLALGGRWDAVAFQDVAHGLVAEGVPEMSQGTSDAIIAPGTVLLRQPYHQGLQFLVDRGATRSFA